MSVLDNILVYLDSLSILSLASTCKVNNHLISKALKNNFFNLNYLPIQYGNYYIDVIGYRELSGESIHEDNMLLSLYCRTLSISNLDPDGSVNGYANILLSLLNKSGDNSSENRIMRLGFLFRKIYNSVPFTSSPGISCLKVTFLERPKFFARYLCYFYYLELKLCHALIEWSLPNIKPLNVFFNQLIEMEQYHTLITILVTIITKKDITNNKYVRIAELILNLLNQIRILVCVASDATNVFISNLKEKHQKSELRTLFEKVFYYDRYNGDVPATAISISEDGEQYGVKIDNESFQFESNAGKELPVSVMTINITYQNPYMSFINGDGWDFKYIDSVLQIGSCSDQEYHIMLLESIQDGLISWIQRLLLSKQLNTFNVGEDELYQSVELLISNHSDDFPLMYRVLSNNVPFDIHNAIMRVISTFSLEQKSISEILDSLGQDGINRVVSILRKGYQDDRTKIRYEKYTKNILENKSFITVIPELNETNILFLLDFVTDEYYASEKVKKIAKAIMSNPYIKNLEQYN